MTKRIARIAIVAAAAGSFVLPASSANASCSWTFVRECVNDVLQATAVETCVPVGTFIYCVPPVSA